jgi:hypothetical protein
MNVVPCFGKVTFFRASRCFPVAYFNFSALVRETVLQSNVDIFRNVDFVLLGKGKAQKGI